jgi:hypothetical protein
MKTQFLAWLKQNWKLIKRILIGLGILLLILSFVSNCVQSDRYKQIKKDHKELKEEKKIAQHKLDSLVNAYQESQNLINLANLRSDSIKKASDKVIEGMKRKEGQYLQTIADLKTIPSDTVYKRIFAYNPNVNNDPLRYPFGAAQIKNIYSDHLSLNYNLGLVNDFTTRFNLCTKDNQVKSGIILQKDNQIGSLYGQLKINEEMITNLSSDNKVLEKSYKGERRWKIIWRTASIVEGGFIVYQSLKK